MIRIQRSVLALCGLLAMSFAACGDLPDSRESSRPAHRVVSPAAVRAQPAGSPERTFLSWYRSVQLGDDKSVSAAAKPSLGLTPQGASVIRVAARQYIAALGPPKIVGATKTPDGASVYTIIPTETRQPNGRLDIFRRPRAFHMVREHGRWRLNDFQFLLDAVKSREAALGGLQ